MEKGWNQRFSFDGMMHDDSSEPVLILPPDTGEQLAMARKRLNLSAQEVAEALKLTEKIILAIENRDYDQLYGIAYATGYVRSYAKLVNLNPDVLIQNDPELGIVDNNDNDIQTELRTPAASTSISASWGAIILRAIVIASILIASIAIWTKREEITAWWETITLSDNTVQEQTSVPDSDSNLDSEQPSEIENPNP